MPKGQSKMDNPEKLATQCTQDEEKKNHHTICVGHHYAQTKITAMLQQLSYFKIVLSKHWIQTGCSVWLFFK